MEQKRSTNVIIISGQDARMKTEKYIYSLVSRMQPKVYNRAENKCIKIWVIDVLLEYALEIANLMRHSGLIIVSKKRKEMNTGSYILPDAWEIILEKIPVLQMLGEESEEEL